MKNSIQLLYNREDTKVQKERKKYIYVPVRKVGGIIYHASTQNTFWTILRIVHIIGYRLTIKESYGLKQTCIFVI